MIKVDLGPHEEVEESKDQTVYRSYHVYRDCFDEDIGYKYNAYYMKEYIFKTGKPFEIVRGANPFVHDRDEEFNKVMDEAIKLQKKIFEETGEIVHIL